MYLGFYLKDLKIGDWFYHANNKKIKSFIVAGKPTFNISHRSSTIDCIDTSSCLIVSKSSRLKVVKI